MMLLLAAVAFADPLTPAQTEVARLASARDDLGCAALIAASPQPAVDLRAVAEAEPGPPWAAMRAGACLLGLSGPEPAAAALAWAADPDRGGLARLAAHRVDSLTESARLPVTEALLAGPHADRVRATLSRAADPGVSARASRAPAAD